MQPKRLGELVLRTTRMNAMIRFYRDVIGLEDYLVFNSARFFKVAEDFDGHPQLLALFEAGKESNGPGEPQFGDVDVQRTTVHHFAFALEKTDFLRERERLTGLGLDIRTATHMPMQWSSFYVNDPQGNTVEFVCHDEDIEV